MLNFLFNRHKPVHSICHKSHWWNPDQPLLIVSGRCSKELPTKMKLNFLSQVVHVVCLTCQSNLPGTSWRFKIMFSSCKNTFFLILTEGIINAIFPSAKLEFGCFRVWNDQLSRWLGGARLLPPCAACPTPSFVIRSSMRVSGVGGRAIMHYSFGKYYEKCVLTR